MTCKECVHYGICEYSTIVDRAIKCKDFICKVNYIEVVRCKDCKHATFYSCKNDACYNAIICEYRLGAGDENFFCSYGERR